MESNFCSNYYFNRKNHSNSAWCTFLLIIPILVAFCIQSLFPFVFFGIRSVFLLRNLFSYLIEIYKIKCRSYQKSPPKFLNIFVDFFIKNILDCWEQIRTYIEQKFHLKLIGTEHTLFCMHHKHPIQDHYLTKT